MLKKLSLLSANRVRRLNGMSGSVAVYYRLPIKMIKEKQSVPYIAVIDSAKKLHTSHTQLPINDEEREFLGEWGKEAELNQIKNMPEELEG